MKHASILSVLFLLMLPLITTMSNVSYARTEPGNAYADKGDQLPKVGYDLTQLYDQHTHPGLRTSTEFESLFPVIGERVVIDAVASGDTATLEAELQALGMENVAAVGRMVSGSLPIDAIDDISGLDSLRFARPAYATTSVGLVTSQGDQAMRADKARTTFGVDGSGITIGTLSDSYDCLRPGSAATDVANGDLPAGVTVLEDLSSSGCSDEGRAMMQLIHDVAPGANQAFHTAYNGEANFAQGIRDLAAAGADVIVDDVIYFAEPMFQDGIIAQAVDDVVDDGVVYFSSAGNSARRSYENGFNPGQTYAVGAFPSDPVAPIFSGGTAHDFGNGDLFQRITLPAQSSFGMSLQWDDPFASVGGAAGADSDLDVYFFNDPPTRVLFGAATDNIGSDPVEASNMSYSGAVPLIVNVMIVKRTGPNPGRMKYWISNSRVTINEFDTASSTAFGHSNAIGAQSVGAAFYRNTPVFGVNPAQLESFSSAGGTPILFDSSGNRLTTPEIRSKPEIVAPDGANTTFFGSDSTADTDSYPNFFGTSAAAPHAAAVAALMRQANPDLTPAELYAALEETALDMAGAGFDFDSGYGLIQANAAIAATVSQLTMTLTANPSSINEPGGAVAFTVVVKNIGTAAAQLTNLVDTRAGDLDGQGTCDLPQNIAVGASYTCSFTNTVTGEPGLHTNNVTATTTIQGTQVQETTSATVTIQDVLPSIDVAMSATPPRVTSPGGAVTFSVAITNSSVEAMTLTQVGDTIVGNLNGKGTCSLPQSITVGATYTCSFTGSVTGNGGTSKTNSATATATDNEGNQVQDSASTTITIDNAVLPGIDVDKTANPSSLNEPGSAVAFTVVVKNIGTAAAQLTNLVDTAAGDLNGQGTCSLPQSIAVGASYTCNFTNTVTGEPGLQTSSVTATATAQGTQVQETGSAMVTIRDVLPSINVDMNATPSNITAPGEVVTFSVVVTNTTVESVALTRLEDSSVGNLDGQGTCNLPQSIAVGASYSCTFTSQISQSATNSVTATAADNEGNQAQDSASTTVTIGNVVLPGIDVDKTASPSSLNEPGDAVAFTVVVANTGTAAVELTNLVDTAAGNLNGQGTCSLPQSIAVGASYTCGFTNSVTGEPGLHTSTVTATVTAQGTQVQETASATVAIQDVMPSIDVDINATLPSSIALGEAVTFTVAVANTSVEAVVLTSLGGGIASDLNGQGTCNLPQTIAVGASYSCSFTTQIGGGGVDTITATATDNEGNQTQDSANTLVMIGSITYLPFIIK